MENFPKKYNPKILIKDQKSNISSAELYSPSMPLDQKINPWSIFFVYYKDTYCKINQLIGENLTNITWYTVSSIYHSSLDTTKSNTPKIQLSKQIQKNLSFIQNLWLDIDRDQKNFAMTEDFCRYIRHVFSKFFSDNKLNHGQNTVSWSKTYQTDMSSLNMTKKVIETPKFTIKYFIEAKGVAINVVTTRIETIFADVAIAVNPADKRYKKLIWQNVLIPIINKNIPIIWDESVDVFCGEWAIRVTPGHDSFWLEIAKKHGLPTDIFAIDTDWKFTEHAGEFANKDLSEFLDNIIKYVDDIWNMENQTQTTESRYFDKNTWEELFPMSLSQWTLNYDYAKDYLLNYLQSKDTNPYYKQLFDQLESKTNSSISNKSSRWLLIPVVSNEKWNTFSLDDETIINIYDQKKTKKDIALTLIILNLILNNNLPQIFSLQELIDSLFSRNFLWDKTKLQEYIDIYSNQKKSQYKNWLKSLNKLLERLQKDVEVVDSLLDLLKDSFAIHIENDQISINYHDLFWVAWLNLQTQDSFNKTFIDSCRPLYHLWCEYSQIPYSQIVPENRAFMSTNSENIMFLGTNLLSLQYAKRHIFSDFVVSPTLVDTKWEKINNYNSKYCIKDYYENLNKYWPDIMRLTILFSDKKEDDPNLLQFDTYKSNSNSILLNKIWNANRYIFSKYKDKFDWWILKLKDILSTINSGELTDYDNRILHNLKAILDDFNYQISEHKYLSIWKKLLENYSSFFCDKYINISKIVNNENTYHIMMFVWIVYLDLLYPYIPNFVSQIKSKFKIDYQWLNPKNIDFIPKEKNYKINIFTEVVDKINNMKQKIWMKKHEVVDVFVQANPDFLNFLQWNESIFRLLTKIQNINLLWFHEDMPSGCEVDNVINISVWIKKPEIIQVEIKKDVLADLESEYREKLEHVQHLKSLFTSIYWSADPDLLNKKRQEISALQAEIEDLEFKIRKLKINN